MSKEIRKKLELGILERVTDDMGPTPWVANLVPVIKDREVRRARNAKLRHFSAHRTKHERSRGLTWNR